MADKVQVYGVQDTIRTLKTLEPELLKQARKDLRVAAEPMASSIRDYIPNEPPLRGMRHNGRTAWKPSNIKISIKTDFSKRAFTREQALVKVVVGGKKGTPGTAGLQIADMAGRANKVRKGKTRQYSRGTASNVSHRLNGQGKAMIDYLNANWGRASRFVWRAAELHKSTVQTSVLASLDKIAKEFNNKLQVK